MKVTVVMNGSDWEGLYIDGKLKIQKERIGEADIEEVFKAEYERRYCDPQHHKFRVLPENMDEVKWASWDK